MSEEIIKEAEVIEAEDVQEDEQEKESIKIKKGILFYDDENDVQGYTFVGKEAVTIKDLAFYKAYLERLENHLWKDKGGFEDAGNQE